MNNISETRGFLGIDGGGSTCRARLSDRSGKVIGEGFAGPANFRLGMDQIKTQIESATHKALAQAGMPDLPLKSLRAGLGLAGMVLPADHKKAEPIKDLFAECTLTNDAYIACLGAHLGQSGGILVLGTGSCAQIISPEGSRTFGGWGFAIADHSSGAWIGREAIRLALLALETVIPSSPLAEAVNARFDHRADQFLDWSLTAKPADYAQIAPLVFAHAREGDLHATKLIKQACEDVIRFVNMLDRYATGRIALLGGLATLYPDYLPDSVNKKLCAPMGDALEGALIMARNQTKGTT